MTLEELTERLRAAVARDPVGGQSLKVDLREAGAIRVEGLDVSNDDRPADCTLVLSKADLDRIIAGELDMVEAANIGKIEIQGDVSVAIAMQSALFAAWLTPSA